MSKILSKSEALKEINNGKTIISKLKDGHIELKKVNKTVYEARVFEGDSEVEVLNGDFKSLMKIMNRPDTDDEFYIKGW